ncbi:MAG: DsrE family protein [Bdellovibrionota bacterium]
MSKSLTILLMDPPYESSNTATALRLIEATLNQGHHVNVFAYEGATALTFKHQKGHPNPVKETSIEEEKHPLTKDLIAGLFQLADKNNVNLKWVNCGFCVDERGVGEWEKGPERGGPPQFAKMVNQSDKTLVIATTR